jgi:arsenate reductase
MDVTIYHNPMCGTSRNTLAMIREAGIEPRIVEYLKTPPSRIELAELVARMGVPLSAVLRAKEPLARELGLSDPLTSDEVLLDAMAANAILIERPIVVSDKGVRLCRPAETVRELLPDG